MNRSEERTEFLRDIITTAIEGGIGYWSQCSHYQWINDLSSATEEERGRPMVAVGTRNERTDAYAIVHRLNDDESGYEEEGLEINIEVVAKGIGVILSGKGKVHDSYVKRIRMADRENDAGEIDSDDADAIVQAGLFGEVIYG